MQGLPDQLDEADYVTVPRSEWRALLEEVATIRRLVAELAARLPAVDDTGDDEGHAVLPRSSGADKEAASRDDTSSSTMAGATSIAGEAAVIRPGSATPAGPGRPAARVALRPTVVRRDELGRSIRAYEVPLQSVRPSARRSPAARREATPVAGARTPTLEALRARVDQAAAGDARAKRASRLTRWTSRLSGRHPDSGSDA